jgi:tetratricopeptide (TPR) repeat protein
VRTIDAWLSARGLVTWLDERELVPGDVWEDVLEEVLGKVPVAAILIGEHGLGSWETPETRVLLDEQTKRGLRVIPVLLPGAPDLTNRRFLNQFTWNDLREGVTDPGLERLEAGIRKGLVGQSVASSQATGAPHLHNLPFLPLGELFKGRDEELVKLEASLGSPGQAAAITQRQALYGLGGIGKTRLAVEYAWRFGARYTAVFFLRADSEAALRSSLAELARRPYLNLPEREVREEELQVGAVLAWLREHPGWLLILDNVDSEDAAEAVLDLLPELSTGRVLLTTRRKEWPVGISKQPLDTLSLDESVAFLLQRTEIDRQKTAEDEAQARLLADLLDGLPLALEQAAAYVNHNQISLARYLRAWESERERVLGWFDPKTMQYPLPLAMTWQATFERLSPTAQAILTLCSFLATEPIPDAMIETCEARVCSAVEMLPERTAQVGEEAPLLDALAELAAYSMIIRQEGAFTLHRLVQEVLRSGAARERAHDWIETAAWLVADFAPTEIAGDVRTWTVWKLLRPHAEAVVAWADAERIESPTNSLHTDLGTLLQAKSLFAEAERHLRRALAVCEASASDETKGRLALCLNNLAQLLQETNRLDEAEPLMRRALDIWGNALGDEHPQVATAFNNLALLLQDTNRLAEAQPLMRRALDIDRKVFGDEHPDVARDLNNLAQLLQDTNRLAEAEPLMRQALDIWRNALGDEHPRVATAFNNLARLLQDTNRLDEAEPLVRQALDIWRNALGAEHPQVATAFNNLARLLQDTNRLAEAEPLIRQALGIWRNALGDEHPQVATAFNNLALLLQDTNRLAEAEPLMRQALDIDRKALGDDHPNVAIRLNNLATLLHDTNRLAEAEPLARRAAEIFQASLGSEHPHTRTASGNHATILQALRAVESDSSPTAAGSETIAPGQDPTTDLGS